MALKMPEVGLRAYRNKPIAASFDFLLWSWNWMCAAMVKSGTMIARRMLRDFKAIPHFGQFTTRRKSWDCAQEKMEISLAIVKV